MKVLGLDLDNSPLLMEDKSLKYAENIVVDDKAQSYINEPCWFQALRLSGEPFNDKMWTLVGSITTPNGFILFGLLDDQSAIIAYNQETNSIYKTYVGNLNFNIDYPITGVYTYKNEELIIIFRDDINGLRVLNIDSFKSDENNTIDDTELNLLEFSPDLDGFNLNVSISTKIGSLLTGSYQIAVKFKTIFDNYTNYTNLSETINIYSSNYTNLSPNKQSDKSIDVNLNVIDNFLYTSCKFAIIHITDEAQLVYETPDIELTSDILNYTIRNLNLYETISLEDVLIKSMNYKFAKDLTIMNNQLILGNIHRVKPLLDSNPIEVEIGCTPIELEEAIKNKKPFFQAGEIYVFYIALYDKKGELINIYPIEYKPITHAIENIYNCETETINVDNTTFNAHLIPNSIEKSISTPIKVFSGDTWVFSDPEKQETELIKFLDYDSGLDISTTHNIIPTNIAVTSDGILSYRGTKLHIIKRVYTLNEASTDYIESSQNISDTFINDPNLLNYITFKENYGKILYIDVNQSVYSQAFNVFAVVNIPQDLKDVISSYQILYIQHDYTNSKILTQSLIIYDTCLNDFANQQYKGQFTLGYNDDDGKYHQGGDKRVYSFDLLYNKPNTIKIASLSLTSTLKSIKDDNVSGDFQYTPVYNWDKTNKEFTTIDKNGVTINIKNQDIPRIPPRLNEYTLDLILANNTQQNNIAGDTYYKLKSDIGFTDGIYNLYNTFQYNSLYNQKLQPACSIKSANLYDNVIYESDSSLIYQSVVSLKGDSYIDYLTIRATTPSEGYFFGDNNYPERDSNKTVYRWIYYVPLISKLNINAHYSTITNKVYKFNLSIFDNNSLLFDNDDICELLNLPYERDNPINNDLDVNYSTVYNETGIEQFIYGDILNIDNNYKCRLVRSLYYNPEAQGLPLLIFKSDDYKDLPAKYGAITVLNTNDNFLYVHQENNLSYLSIRDTLGIDPNTGASYLSSSDLFNMEAKTLGFDATGFISCNSKFDTHMNHSGYYVIDNKLHKIFKISKDSILDITNKNVSRYFKDNIQTLTDNNPFKKNQGRYLFYNNDTNTLHFVQKQNNLNISYKPIIDKWISFHTRHPLFVINNTHKVFDLSSKYIYSPSNSYDHSSSREPSYIKIVFNQYQTYNKQFNVVSWLDRVTIDDLAKYNETISQIAVCTDYQGTDFKNVNVNQKWYDSVSGVKKINQWRFNEIWDIVKTTPFMNNPITFIQSALNNKIKWYNKNKIVDQYCYVILKFNNTYSKKWELIDIGVEFDLDNRNKQYEDKKE